MDFEELMKILNEQNGIKCCPICFTPFSPYNSRQRTCGDPECKRANHSRRVSERSRERKAQDPDVYRKYNRDKMRKYRRKQEVIERWEERERYWEERKRANDNVTGVDYGKRSAEKTLAKVPKIDVNIGEPKGGGDEYDN